VRYLFEGKRVAILGSSPTILDHEHGAEIDAHDVVMRINLHGIHGRPECMGSRTDVRFLGGRIEESWRPVIHEAAETKALMLRAKNEWVARAMKVPAYYTELRMYGYLTKLSPNLLIGIDQREAATSGANAIAIALDAGAVSVDLYGFTLDVHERLDTIAENGQLTKYDPVELRRYHCDPAQEIELLKRVMQHYPVAIGGQS